MDFWRTVLVLFRRWYITLPAFFFTLAAAGAAFSAIPVEYQSGAVLVLNSPLSGGTKATDPKAPTSLTNPLLNFDQSLALTASIVIQQMNSPETGKALGITPGGSTTYEVNNGTTNPELLQTGPQVFIEANGPSAEAAQALAEKAATMAGTILDERQTELNAPPSTHITMQVVVPPTTGQPLVDSPLRAAAAVGALAAVASLAAVYGFESLMTQRRRRREERQRAALQDERLAASGPDPGAEPDYLAGGSPTRRLPQRAGR